jgi:hypothetical protein
MAEPRFSMHVALNRRLIALAKKYEAAAEECRLRADDLRRTGGTAVVGEDAMRSIWETVAIDLRRVVTAYRDDEDDETYT